ncbi:helix-turn-helix domain-containing protein [Nocardioides caricicola]|uniref:Helix-turn-helix domain-containing protein n=1 Tax=Nocardioides caricicola TaxID=634770 RepID=A0ABW0N6D9_9ACTN
MTTTDFNSPVHVQPALLTPAEVSEILQVPTRTLERWRTERRGPRFGRFGRHVRYRRVDVDAYISAACGDGFDLWMAS